jgi:SAM-dependent methyltransferase
MMYLYMAEFSSVLKKTFLLESPSTPIHQRIAQKYVEELQKLGHQVILLHSQQFQSHIDLIQHVNQYKADFCIFLEPISTLSGFSDETQCFLFELIDTKLIFIHYETTLGCEISGSSVKQRAEYLKRKLIAFQKHEQRSHHFCIEYYMFLDLRSLGISKAHKIYHASEFVSDHAINSPDSFQFETSFVGHVIPGFYEVYGDDFLYSHLLYADFWNRVSDLTSGVERSAIDFSERFQNQIFPEDNTITKTAFKYLYVSLYRMLSLASRGEVLKRITNTTVDIIGGDPSYLNQQNLNRQIKRDNIKYHPANFAKDQVQSIYSSSKINLNITSLQFDTAIVNRVVDIAGVGGFVLTDWKPDLARLTSVASEISYRTIEELNAKLAYYSDPTHESERLEIADTLRQDIQKSCTYEALINFILNQLDTMEESSREVLRVDLGCGTRKPEGFLGVDVFPAPHVDIVADLTQRFPFPDSSVDFIRGYDVIEHLSDRLHTMNEIWRIGKPGAIVDLQVPSTDGRGAFQDPTHVSFWNINSFKYYCVEFPVYLDLCHRYGFKGAFSIVDLTERISDDQVVHIRAVLKVEKPSLNEQNTELNLNLRDINFVIFPNWQSSEEELATTLSELFKVILEHPESSHIALLVVLRDIDQEEAGFLISSVLMDLLYNESVNNSEDEPEIIFLESPSPQEWQTLQNRITARVQLSQKDDELNMLIPENIKTLAIEDIRNNQWVAIKE